MTKLLAIDLTNKRAFIAGVGDERGFGWAIAKALAEAGATLLIGTWAPVYEIFDRSFRMGKFDEARKLQDGRLMEFAKIYPIDANFDGPEDVPADVRANKRYAHLKQFTLSEVAAAVSREFGHIDCLVHSLANAPEIKKPLLQTTRQGYLAALNASSYSLVGLLKHFSPLMSSGSSALALTYLASQRTIPGYGGGMSSAKAALESDVRALAWELGRDRQLRINAISAGPLKSRAASAIGFIDQMISYSQMNAPLAKSLEAREVAQTAAFLLSPLASAITGTLTWVDNGLHSMGVAPSCVN